MGIVSVLAGTPRVGPWRSTAAVGGVGSAHHGRFSRRPLARHVVGYIYSTAIVLGIARARERGAAHLAVSSRPWGAFVVGAFVGCLVGALAATHMRAVRVTAPTPCSRRDGGQPPLQCGIIL